MKVSKIVLFLSMALAFITLTSTTCNTSDDPTPECNVVAAATSTDFIEQSFCFDNVTTYNYDPTNYISFWARESNSNYGFDLSINAVNDQTITTGTYQCGSGNPGFVELIMEDINTGDSEFYKSQSGSITITAASETSFKASFDVVAKGYYNGESIHFTGTINK